MTTRGDRAESVVLVLILTTVAGAAGAASFTHMHEWTMRNVPAGTPSAFGWTNAVISELVPVAALLTIRRRRRAGAPITYPVLLLVASAVLSLSAQLAVASPSLSGWLLAAVPALAFMALIKLVFSDAGHQTQAMAENVPETPASHHAEAPAVDVPAAPEITAAVPRPAAVVPVPANAFTRQEASR